MTAFDIAVEFVLQHETEYQPGHYGDDAYVRTEHDPDDPGETTRYGIDKASHPDVDVEHLTRAQAIEIYRRSYWNRIHGDEIPERLAFVLFDIAVNNGVSRAIRWLQRAMGLVQDGVWGPMTGHAARLASEETVTELLQIREQFYISIATGTKRKYLRGWLNRNHDLAAALDVPLDRIA